MLPQIFPLSNIFQENIHSSRIKDNNNKHILFVNETNDFLLDSKHCGNVIIITHLKECFIKNAFSSFSLKILSEGSIKFKIQEKDIILNNNELLLGASQFDASGYIDSENDITFISIDISSNTLDEAFYLVNKENNELADEFKNYFQFSILLDLQSDMGKLLNVKGLSVVIISKAKNKIISSNDYAYDRKKFFEAINQYLK